MEAPLSTSKLRLMCSYGGQILPHPNFKSLCYIGGDNRIISVNRTTVTSLSALVFHLSVTLSIPANFSVKYQLPNRDLDSLVLVSDNDELQIMLDLHDRLLVSNNPSRIRLFLFPSHLGFAEAKVERNGYVFHHPKTEAWFVDALKSARIMQKGRNGFAGFEGDDGIDAQSDGDSIPESILLETSSSFGSTLSSVSSSHLPAITNQFEEFGTNLQDGIQDLPPQESILRDNNVTHLQNGMYHGFENGSVPEQWNSHMQNNQQFVHAGAYNIPQYRMGHLTAPSYYQVYQPDLQHPHQLHYQANQPSQPYPICLVPVGHDQPYNLPPPGYTATIASSHSARHLNDSSIYSKVAGEVAADQTSYVTVSEGMPLVHNQSSGNHQQSLSATTEIEDGLARLQIYKSQPTAPRLPSQYQTMTKSATLMFSEALG